LACKTLWRFEPYCLSIYVCFGSYAYLLSYEFVVVPC
jgi:hypothetical protein